MCSGGKRRENAVKVPYFSVGKKKMNCSLLYLPPPLLSRGWFVALSTLMRLVNHKRRTSVKRPPAKSCFCSIWNVTNYKRSLNQLQWADGADPIHLGPNSGACFSHSHRNWTGRSFCLVHGRPTVPSRENVDQNKADIIVSSSIWLVERTPHVMSRDFPAGHRSHRVGLWWQKNRLIKKNDSFKS